MVPKGGTLLPGDTAKVLLKFKLWLLARVLWTPCVLGPAGRKRSHCPGRSN